MLDLLERRNRNGFAAAFDYLVEAYEAALGDRTIQHEPPLKNPVAYARYVAWDALRMYQWAEKSSQSVGRKHSKMVSSASFDFSKLEAQSPRLLNAAADSSPA